MSTLIVKPQNLSELDLLVALLKKMQIQVTVLEEEEKEDLAPSFLMQEADRDDKVSRESIFAKLRPQ
jgi:hypothetical protein